MCHRYKRRRIDALKRCGRNWLSNTFDSDVCCFPTLGGKYQAGFRSRERMSCYISQPKTGGISKLETFGAKFQPLKLHLYFLVALAHFFTEIQRQGGNRTISDGAKIIDTQLV